MIQSPLRACLIGTLLLCGGLKILYDLLLLAAFRHIKPPEEKA